MHASAIRGFYFPSLISCCFFLSSFLHRFFVQSLNFDFPLSLYLCSALRLPFKLSCCFLTTSSGVIHLYRRFTRETLPSRPASSSERGPDVTTTPFFFPRLCRFPKGSNTPPAPLQEGFFPLQRQVTPPFVSPKFLFPLDTSLRFLPPQFFSLRSFFLGSAEKSLLSPICLVRCLRRHLFPPHISIAGPKRVPPFKPCCGALASPGDKLPTTSS